MKWVVRDNEGSDWYETDNRDRATVEKIWLKYSFPSYRFRIVKIVPKKIIPTGAVNGERT